MGFPDFPELVFTFVALLVALSVHEFAHAYLADVFGDPTPRMAGRVTLNPLAHIDLAGTLFLIFFKFGWGKPVPVNPHYFRHPVAHNALVAFAGPFANFFCALLISGIFFLFRDVMPYSLEVFLMMILDVNLYLGIFNLLPLPPLDGSKFIMIFLPRKFHPAYERYLQYGILYTMIFLLFDLMVLPNIFGYSLVLRFIEIVFPIIKGAIFIGS